MFDEWKKGDLVVCWRAAMFASAYYLAIVVEAPCKSCGEHNDLVVRPLSGLFRFKRKVISGVWHTTKVVSIHGFHE